jgi:hypothetical protein
MDKERKGARKKEIRRKKKYLKQCSAANVNILD